MYYPDELVEEVRTRNDIVEVISQYVKLTKKGSNYFGLCPFHNEKTGSFSVVPSKQMYYCFGCGAGGNVITFIMEYENYTFQEALSYLAERAGIELPKRDESAQAKREADVRSQLLAVHKEAARYYYYQLKSPAGEKGLSYFRQRGLSDETITRFGLGYSLPGRNYLYQYLRKKGYSDEILSQSGLVRLDEKGAYDKFWNRVMFPIMDTNNRVIGFGGRVMGEGEPKYLNSPETKIFDKSSNLYGLNVAKSSRKPYLLICEGYMDVIAMHQAGFTNAVASLGTAFTARHATLIKRYVKQAVLTYDSDQAGVKAALRAIPILRSAGISVKVLSMKPYKDPDEFIKNLGREAFEERIEQAVNGVLFEVDAARENFDMEDPEQKTAFHNFVVDKLVSFPDELERNNYMEAIAARHFIPLDSLRRMVNTKGNTMGYGEAEAEPEPVKRNRKNEKEEGIRKAQRMMLTWLSEEPGLFGVLKKYITPKDFTEPLYQKVAEMMWEELEKGSVEPAAILDRFVSDQEQYREVAAVFNSVLSVNDVPAKEEKEKAVTETLKKIRKNRLDEESRVTMDVGRLQEIMAEQAALNQLHISFD